MARVLVGCEFSGIVRDAFRAKGHCAHSVDLLYCERDYPVQDAVCPLCHQRLHFYGDLTIPAGPSSCRQQLWDLIIAFPPCTHLASSGARWFKFKQNGLQRDSIEFVKWLAGPAWIPSVAEGAGIAIENPIGVLSTHWRKPDQIIQPWMFGHGETKATCLWLKNLPLLKPTNIVEGRVGRVWREPPSPSRWKNRSRTYQGIADAMAEQWGAII